MKKLYSLILACLLSAVVMAQSTSKSSNSGVKFGIKAGVNFAKIAYSGEDDEDTDGYKAQTSFQFGGYADIPVGTSFSIQPGLTLSGKGEKYEESETGYSYKESVNIMYLEIPVNAVYKIGGIYLGAGPYAAFALSGKYKVEETDEPKVEDDIKFGSDEDQMKGTDFGVNFLAGYELTNGLNFGVNYGLGLSNLSNSNDGKAKNSVFSVTVGFSF